MGLRCCKESFCAEQTFPEFNAELKSPFWCHVRELRFNVLNHRGDDFYIHGDEQRNEIYLQLEASPSGRPPTVHSEKPLEAANSILSNPVTPDERGKAVEFAMTQLLAKGLETRLLTWEERLAYTNRRSGPWHHSATLKPPSILVRYKGIAVFVAVDVSLIHSGLPVLTVMHPHRRKNYYIGTNTLYHVLGW